MWLAALARFEATMPLGLSELRVALQEVSSPWSSTSGMKRRRAASPRCFDERQARPGGKQPQNQEPRGRGMLVRSLTLGGNFVAWRHFLTSAFPEKSKIRLILGGRRNEASQPSWAPPGPATSCQYGSWGRISIVAAVLVLAQSPVRG